MRHYMQIKSEYPDLLLFYQMGDFYELFYADAEKASRLLDLTLTSRSRAGNAPVPMAGVPVHSVDSYIAKLIRCGESIVICDQIGDPKASKGLVERKIVRIVTPGTLTEETLLQAKSDNFLMAVYRQTKTGAFGIALSELSAGIFNLLECPSESDVADEIERFKPAEILASEEQAGEFSFATRSRPAWHFDLETCRRNLCEQMQTRDLAGFGCDNMDAALCAAGALLGYLKETQRGGIPHLRRLSVETHDNYLQIDAASRACLEIDRSLSGHDQHTLFAIYDHASCAMGGRCLKRWFNQPLKDHQRIGARQDAIAWLIDGADREGPRGHLEKVADIERIASRIALHNARPRDLIGLRETLRLLPEIKSLISASRTELLDRLNDTLHEQPELVALLDKAIIDEPPASIRDGGMLKTGFDEELDELRSLTRHTSRYVMELERREKQRTGIESMRVAYSKVHGFYIEMPKARAKNAPDDYIRTQTLKNTERFTLPELKEYETKIVTASERALAREKMLYQKLLEGFAPHISSLYTCARGLATLDVLATLAHCAQIYNHSRPVFTTDLAIEIKGGRHPVIEKISGHEFIPNDLSLNENDRMLIITGPNMGGKSTYMRQTALIVLLAHIGAWVPAQEARIGRVDRILTRIGASDDITSGRSTFMVEMTEMANILNNATAESLVLVDEIGRGTSTFDGLSLAWACAAHMATVNHSYTMFATHYFELTALPQQFATIKNVHIDAIEHKNKIVFMYKVKQGPANKSYGLQVARLAGVPEETIVRARKKLGTLEKSAAAAPGGLQQNLELEANGGASPADEAAAELQRAVEQIEPDKLTPRQALEQIYLLKSLLK